MELLAICRTGISALYGWLMNRLTGSACGVGSSVPGVCWVSD